MNRETYDRATGIAQSIRNLAQDLADAESMNIPFSGDCPEEAKSYVAAVTGKIRQQITEQEKKLEAL